LTFLGATTHLIFYNPYANLCLTHCPNTHLAAMVRPLHSSDYVAWGGLMSACGLACSPISIHRPRVRACAPGASWLLKEIVVSSIQVSRIILSPKLQIQPQFITVKSLARSDVGQVIFGNSITLTPGTMTSSISESGDVTVHALTQDGADGVLQGSMNLKVALLDRSEKHA
jgi:hypothetical protein